MFYKKLFKQRNMRLKILDILSFVPDKIMLRMQYFIYFKKRLSFRNPKRFTEKIQLYKVKYYNDLLPILVDKYTVRSYLEERGLSEYLTDLYFVSDNIAEIYDNWNNFPESFIIKESAGAGGQNVLVVNDKDNFDLRKLEESFDTNNTNLRKNPGREWPYDKIKNKFIVEELLVDPNEIKGIRDYKFLCFNGIVEYIVVDYNRFVNHERNIYDINWNNQKIKTDKELYDESTKKPDNFEDMVKLSEELSKDFPFVRVDLYNINGKIYFGELTFYPWSGYVKFDPISFDYKLGKKFNYF